MATARKPTVKSKSKAKPSKIKKAQTTTEDLHKKIEVEAYLLAEKRRFQDGDPVADWYMAEQNIINESNVIS